MRDTIPADTLRAAEDKLLAQCITTVEGLLDFSALGYLPDGKVDEDGLPAAWEFLSVEEKARKIRLAQYGCLPSADIPHGAKLAHSTLIGIIKARSQEKSGTKNFFMEVSTFPAPAPLNQSPEAIDAEYEVIDVE